MTEQTNTGPAALVPLELLYSLTSPDGCELDHHGYCQAHCWFHDAECPDARVKRILARHAKKKGGS